MKNAARYLTVGFIALTVASMTGCTPGNNVPGSTAAGAVAGGLLGSAISGGSAYGIIGGALLGGIVGDQIGQAMDRQDRINMQSAIVNTPVNQEATWTSDQANAHGQHATYTVKPLKNYKTASHKYCREYETVVTVGGKTQKAYGKACRQPDGTWRIVS